MSILRMQPKITQLLSKKIVDATTLLYFNSVKTRLLCEGKYIPQSKRVFYYLKIIRMDFSSVALEDNHWAVLLHHTHVHDDFYHYLMWAGSPGLA